MSLENNKKKAAKLKKKELELNQSESEAKTEDNSGKFLVKKNCSNLPESQSYNIFFIDGIFKFCLIFHIQK